MIFLVDKTYLAVTTDDRAKAKLRHSMIVQECLLYKIEEWEKADKFFFHILQS